MRPTSSAASLSRRNMGPATVVRVTDVLGHESDERLRSRIDDRSHAGRLELLHVTDDDLERIRLRCATDRGTDCVITLPRGVSLYDGAVVHLSDDRAVVVRAGEIRRLVLTARTPDAALRLGWAAGHLHWRVLFEDERLVVTLDGPESAYLARISELVGEGGVDVLP